MHRLLRAIGAGLGLLLLSAELTQAAGQVTPFTVRYDFKHNGLLLARMERRLHRAEDDTFVFESSSRTAGILSAFLDERIEERSLWTYADGIPRPLHYRYHRTGKKARHVELEFDWDKGIVTNTINKDPWRMTVPPGTQDKLLYQYTLMRDLQNGKRTFDYQVADGGQLKTYHFEWLGRERIDTPLGMLDTVKLQRIHGSRRTVIWCAADLEYLPVRIVQYKDGKSLTMSVRQVEGITLPKE